MKQVITQLLDELESREALLLTWGNSQGYFSEDEVLEAIEHIQKAGADSAEEAHEPYDVIDAMLDKGLFVSWTNADDEACYRTRMAESVRLFSTLRQQFPKHARGEAWKQAPTLVSDYRFLRRKRKYPRRDLSTTEVLDTLSKKPGLSAVERRLLGELLRHEHGFFDLARFQQQACDSVLRGVRRKGASGSIVCAGTGSGKTLAFYLPALTHIAGQLVANRGGHVQALAIYPRNELLKDQFIETWRQARKLDAVLAEQGKPKLRIGAYFGMAPTSKNSVFQSYMKKAWQRRQTGYACQYIPCPDEKCKGSMVWLDDDHGKGIERLCCDSCNKRIEPDEVALTRQSMEKHVPDLLFTTTEMLNRQMGNPNSRKLFGIGKQVTPPTLMLLDEVHTYSGVGGAQAGMLLRRWRHMARASPHFVGLSATLEQAPRFLASLVGLKEYQVAEVSPLEDEMEQEGAEYMLALRGDPASRSSLLSTTIQASMLAKRVMDNVQSPVSDGLYGTRNFVFTDDIDVINRLYFQLLDAEGRYSNGNINAKKNPLALLRQPVYGDQERFAYGQSWDLPLAIGHNLDENDRANVKRTSSQDAGVDQQAEVIVATASLEVGFNDPTVGAVIQHKAPRDNAQFLQRKGRAGRQRRMRPWTVVVLSDYGRDRMAFQCYEDLFDPELKARRLPVHNSYVLRIQAAFATMDWLSQRPGVASPIDWGGIWEDLSCPQGDAALSRRQTVLKEEILRLLREPAQALKLTDYLTDALGLELANPEHNKLIQSLLWQPPRAILTAFLPTVLRRLTTSWEKAGVKQNDNCRRNAPMPEFVPAALFSELCLPELMVRLPEADIEPGAPAPQMPILQGMRDFAPGRISKRFATESIRQRHWMVPEGFEPIAGDHVFPITDYCPVDRLEAMGVCQIDTAGGVKTIPCFRAYEVNTSTPPDEWNLQDTSQAFLNWHTEIRPPATRESAELPERNMWRQVFCGVEFFTHQQHRPVEVIRLATGSRAELKFKGDKDSAAINFEFQHEDQPASLAFSLWVDAVAFRCRMPEFHLDDLMKDEALLFGVRTARFIDEVRNDKTLTENVFLAGWLAESLLAGLCCEAVLSQCSLEQALQALRNGTAQVALQDIPACIFQTLPGTSGEQGEQDLQQNLRDLLGRDGVVEKLAQWAELLWQQPDAGWLEWLQQCFQTTLGAALQQTAMQLCQDADEQDVVLDLDPGPARREVLDDDEMEIWLSESTVGGGGIIERIQQVYFEDPRRFFELLDFNLRAGDYETMDNHVYQLLGVLQQDADMAASIQAMRTANDHQSQLQAQRDFLGALQQRGFLTSHSFMSAVNSRLLRPGSNQQSDRLLLQLQQDWRVEEARLGIELPQRVYAFTCSLSNHLDKLLPQAAAGQQDLQSWRFKVCNGLLWPRGHVIRDAWLSYYNPYAFAGTTERLLVRACVGSACEQVALSDDDWMTRCHSLLDKHGKCELVAKPEQDINLALAQLLVKPVDMYGLFFYPRVASIRREQHEICAQVEIAEAVQ
ncbi:DEAD/DEAH box helicase domain protein [Ferrimonas balearica DSM 9799]|uniref:DEAD/DEAH box helicase domain protein n=1 Tax=Ferrimonas balearica (strain DSM 9799 / CCM 4581 / KCTC 23876 / PAT) TaxID=550540 RepID=E1SVY7_FERBD|nr:protein DpdJ [Ferrimonas balearica]ADN77438.1 DEAD/DEAH box helicase domain protein [Ferrimonas balearica DSM 9799]